MKGLYQKFKNILRENWRPIAISEEKYRLANALPSNPVIIEAGGHNGYDTLQMARLWPESIIYSFEPVPENFFQLRNSTLHKRNVKTFEFALATDTGMKEIFISDNWTASSSLMVPKDHLIVNPQVVFNRTLSVNTIHLDTWLQQQNIPKVDLLWLDMQGMELQVLKSSPLLMKQVSVVYTEVHTKENYEGVPHYNEVKLWFESQGFEVLFEEITYVDGGNVAFKKKS